ncbi:MAG: HD domain-containing protein, partial [Armatimonadota bacterium]
MRVTDPRTLAANTLVALRTDPNAAAILRLASSRKERIYIVGGYLRDVALGFTPRDVDLVMRDATAAAREFAKETGASLIALQEREDGVLRRAQFRLVVRSSGGEGAVYDFGEMCEGGIESDLSQRDFTINAIALPLPPAAEEASPVVIAPSGALADLADRLVRLVRPDAVERDSLRILRAFRFAATLDFSIEPATSGHLARMASRVCEPAPERTQAELLKMMSASRSARVVRQMAALGVLTRLFPELEGTRGVMQPRFHHLDVFEHSIATYEALEDVVADLRAWLGEWAPGAARYLAEGERPALLKLAALLHDVGKPETRTEQEDGTVRFHHHDERGAEMMGAVARRLRLSREQSAMLTTLVRHHMRPLQLTAAERAGQLTARAARRMRRDCRPHAVGL